MPPDIFFSYAREDLTRIEPLVRALETCGMAVFLDRRIPGGQQYRDEIEAAIKDCRCVVVVWTKYSTKSEWVADEADLGQSRGVLVPVCLDRVRAPLGFRQLQAIDLSEWADLDNSEVPQQFVASVKEMISNGRRPALPQLLTGLWSIELSDQRGSTMHLLADLNSDKTAKVRTSVSKSRTLAVGRWSLE